jgi:DNA-binding MarR family transcriptional regulator
MNIAIVNNDPALDETLAKLPGYALRRAANAAMGDLSARLAKIELRLSEASLLMIVRTRNDVTASEIGRSLDIQRANMVPLLNRLETAGLVKRTPLDRKSYAVTLTKAGISTLEKVDAITASFENDLLAKIPPAHRAHLLPALNALWK